MRWDLWTVSRMWNSRRHKSETNHFGLFFVGEFSGRNRDTELKNRIEVNAIKLPKKSIKNQI